MTCGGHWEELGHSHIPWLFETNHAPRELAPIKTIAFPTCLLRLGQNMQQKCVCLFTCGTCYACGICIYCDLRSCGCKNRVGFVNVSNLAACRSRTRAITAIPWFVWVRGKMWRNSLRARRYKSHVTCWHLTSVAYLSHCPWQNKTKVVCEVGNLFAVRAKTWWLWAISSQDVQGAVSI